MARSVLIRPARAAGFLLFLHAVGVQHAHASGFAVGGNGLVIRSPDRGENWSSSSPGTATLNAVHFVSDLDGWAVGNGGIVLHTDNGGDSWTQTTPATVNLNGVWFVDADHGWAVGEGGKVLRTVNGGGNWTTSSPSTAALYAVTFIDANTGWAAGKGVVLRTVNGGAGWTAAAPSTAALRGVSFVDASHGFVVGANGIVLETSNGGVNWNASSPTSSSLNAVDFVDASRGWAVGFAGSVIRTVNGGASWDEQRPVTAELRAVQFLDERFGWAAGAGGTVLRTIDGGDTWLVSNPAAVALNGIDFASIPTGVSVTVGSEPAGRSFTVDGTDYTSAQTFVWEPGSPHTIATTTTQNGSAGTRYVWQNWSDGGAASHTVSPDGNATYTALFQTQHQLTVQSAGNGTVTPPSGWREAGETVSITATPDPGYGFNGWNGNGGGSYSGWSNPATVTMNAPVTESAAFGTTVTVSMDCVPVGRSFVVDGVTYTAAQQFTWTPGSTHSVDVSSPQDETADTRYVFTRWSDGGAANHTVAPVGNTALTATFRAQYTLTVTAGPGGSVTMVDGWYDAGDDATLTASPDSGYSFQRWVGSGSGAYSGGANPHTIAVNGPVTQQALFVAGSVPATPPALTLLGNAPNPFRTETDIRFGLPQDTEVRIELFDVAGRRLLSDTTAGTTGWQSYHLDVRAGGVALRSGIYFVRVTAAGSAQTTRILLLR